MDEGLDIVGTCLPRPDRERLMTPRNASIPLPRALLLLALLLAPTASAAPSFALEVPDAEGDVMGFRGAPANRTGLDLVRFTSTSDGANVTQVVTFASADFWAEDTITLMELYKDSGDDGSMYWIEVTHVFEASRYYSYAFLRNGSYRNGTPVHVETRVEGPNITVVLPEAAFPADATCLHVNLIAEHPMSRTRRPDSKEGRDMLAPETPACRLPPTDAAPTPERPPDFPPPGGIMVNVKRDPEAPGTRMPTPLPGLPLAVAALAAVALLRRR